MASVAVGDYPIGTRVCKGGTPQSGAPQHRLISWAPCWVAECLFSGENLHLYARPQNPAGLGRGGQRPDHGRAG